MAEQFPGGMQQVVNGWDVYIAPAISIIWDGYLAILFFLVKRFGQKGTILILIGFLVVNHLARLRYKYLQELSMGRGDPRPFPIVLLILFIESVWGFIIAIAALSMVIFTFYYLVVEK